MKKNRQNNSDVFTGLKFCSAPKQTVAADVEPIPALPTNIEPKKYPLANDRFGYPIEACPERAKAVDEINARLKARKLQPPPKKATRRGER